MSSTEGVQEPLLTVQRKVFKPTDKPVTPEVMLEGVVTAADPAITVQAPVPTVGAVAPKVAVAEQTVWSVPAAEILGATTLVMITSSVEGVQTPLLIVQRSVTLVPAVKVTVEVGLEGVVTVTVPVITVQAPVFPDPAALAASVAEVPQTV